MAQPTPAVKPYVFQPYPKFRYCEALGKDAATGHWNAVVVRTPEEEDALEGGPWFDNPGHPGKEWGDTAIAKMLPPEVAAANAAAEIAAMKAERVALLKELADLQALKARKAEKQ